MESQGLYVVPLNKFPKQQKDVRKAFPALRSMQSDDMKARHLPQKSAPSITNSDMLWESSLALG